MSSLVTCSSSLLSVEGDGRLPNPSLKAESYLCHWLMVFIKASTQHTVSYHWKCFLYYTFYYYPIWGALPCFHRDHPRQQVTELGWEELQFFSFTVYNILGCHGGLQSSSCVIHWGHLARPCVKVLFVQNGDNRGISGLERALNYSPALWQGQETWFIPDRCLYNLFLKPFKAFHSNSLQDLKVQNVL